MVAHHPRVPFATTAEVRKRMQRQSRRDTDPEMAVRRALFALKLRYRVHRAVLDDRRRRVDIVFPGARVAVFVDGCFWHCCPHHGTLPRVNRWFWLPKLRKNRARDRATDRSLRAACWRVVRVWEHEDPVRAAERVWRAVMRRVRHGRAPSGAGADRA